MGARISSNLKGSKEETFESRDDVSESDFSSEMPTWLVSRRLWPPLNCKVVKGKNTVGGRRVDLQFLGFENENEKERQKGRPILTDSSST